MFLFPNRKTNMSAAASPTYLAKSRGNLVLLACEYSGYVKKVVGKDLVNKRFGT